jgi:hypothetical protein
MRICRTCKYHREYWDEIDGELYHDGCFCDNDHVKWKGHFNSCLHDNIVEKLVECSHYIEEAK